MAYWPSTRICLVVQQEKLKTLQITWINHTFSHVYYPDVAFDDNFLVTPQTNVTEEILSTEQILLQNRQLLSVFFHFPGLVANEKLIKKIRKFGLVTIGSNAWLAHHQQIENGSIVLVHGNSNESEGIKLIMPLLQKQG